MMVGIFVKIEVNGIVIREVELGNGSRLIDILTGNSGVITAIINNISSRKNNRFASIHALMYCKFVLFKKKEYYSVDEFDILNIFWEVKNDLKSLAICQYFCELCMVLSPEDTVSCGFLRLFLNSVFYVSKKIKNVELIKTIFEMKALSLCGYMPNLVCCCKCGKYDAENMLFSTNSGKIICENCYHVQNGMYAVRITKGMLYALRHIIYSPMEKIFSFEISDNALKVLSKLSENYTKYHLDTNFKSLEFYNRL